MFYHGGVAPAGALKTRVMRRPSTFFGKVLAGLPQPGLPREVNMWRLKNMPHMLSGAFWVVCMMLGSRLSGIPIVYGSLSARVYRPFTDWLDYGTASFRSVTNAGVAFMVDAFQNTTELDILRFHAYGTGTTAEAVGDTALVTELTTQYSPDNTRPTGSQTEAAANIFRSVATLSPDTGGTIAVTEHGLMSQAATGGGTLLDRSVFSAINLVAGTDSLQTTYDFTLTAGG